MNYSPCSISKLANWHKLTGCVKNKTENRFAARCWCLKTIRNLGIRSKILAIAISRMYEQIAVFCTAVHVLLANKYKKELFEVHWQ